MATVPYSGVPSVTQTPASGLPYQTGAGATPEAFGSTVGQAEQGLGNKIEQFGDVLQKHADFYQQRQNQADADQAFVDTTVEAGKVKAWYNTLEGKEAADQYPNYVQQLNAVRDKAIANVANPEARRLFEREFNRRVAFDIESGASHAAQQQRAYQRNAASAVSKIAIQDSALNPEDQRRFDSNLQTVKDAVDKQYPISEVGEDVNKFYKRQDVGKAIEERTSSLGKTQPLAARSLLEKYKNDVDGATYDKLTRSINQNIVQTQSRIDADRIVSHGAGISEDLVNRVKGFEGFEKTSKFDYKQYSIGYGTKGKPGETITREEADSRLRDELGRSAEIVDQAFPGLPTGTRDALISLTYNSGTDWMKSGLGAKIRAGDFEGAKANFLEYNQAGGQFNQGLASRRAQEVAMFGGSKYNPLAEGRQANMMDEAHKRAQELFPDDPGNQATYEDTLQQRVRSNVSVLKSGIVQQQRETRNTVYAEILSPDKLVTSLDQLSPQAQDAYQHLEGVDQAKVRQRLVHNAGVDPHPQSQATDDEYRRLSGLANDPNTRDEFANTNLLDKNLTRSNMNKLLQKQMNLKNLGQEDLKMSKVMENVSALLKKSEIYPEKGNQAKNDQYYLFRGNLQEEVQKFEEEKKRIPNPKESEELASKVLRDITRPGTFGMLFGGVTERGFEAKIPEAEVAKHTALFKKYNNNREPTPVELQTVYRRAKAAEADKKGQIQSAEE